MYIQAVMPSRRCDSSAAVSIAATLASPRLPSD
jgi:hypothetical protein